MLQKLFIIAYLSPLRLFVLLSSFPILAHATVCRYLQEAIKDIKYTLTLRSSYSLIEGAR